MNTVEWKWGSDRVKIRIFTVFIIIFFYRILKNSDYFMKEMKEIIFKLKDTPLSKTPYLAGEFIGATLFFAFHIILLISILTLIVDILKYWE